MIIAACLNIFLKYEMIQRTAYSTNRLISTEHMDHRDYTLKMIILLKLYVVIFCA